MFVEIVWDKRVGNMERAGWSSRIFFLENEPFLKMITANLIQRNDIDITGYLLDFIIIMEHEIQTENTLDL